jgi:hypothetical protein
MRGSFKSGSTSVAAINISIFAVLMLLVLTGAAYLSSQSRVRSYDCPSRGSECAWESGRFCNSLRR